jgi:hypothetical protein
MLMQCAVFPKILALGIMLLEIELRIKIEDYRMPEDVDCNGEPNVNADHIAVSTAPFTRSIDIALYFSKGSGSLQQSRSVGRQGHFWRSPRCDRGLSDPGQVPAF